VLVGFVNSESFSWCSSACLDFGETFFANPTENPTIRGMAKINRNPAKKF